MSTMQLHNWRSFVLTEHKLLWTFFRKVAPTSCMWNYMREHKAIQNMTAPYGAGIEVRFIFLYIYACVKDIQKGLK